MAGYRVSGFQSQLVRVRFDSPAAFDASCVPVLLRLITDNAAHFQTDTKFGVCALLLRTIMAHILLEDGNQSQPQPQSQSQPQTQPTTTAPASASDSASIRHYFASPESLLPLKPRVPASVGDVASLVLALGPHICSPLSPCFPEIGQWL